MLSEKLRIIFQDYWNPSTIKMYIDEILSEIDNVTFFIRLSMKWISKKFDEATSSDFHYQKDKWKDVPLSYATVFYKYLISRLTHA